MRNRYLGIPQEILPLRIVPTGGCRGSSVGVGEGSMSMGVKN